MVKSTALFVSIPKVCINENGGNATRNRWREEGPRAAHVEARFLVAGNGTGRLERGVAGRCHLVIPIEDLWKSGRAAEETGGSTADSTFGELIFFFYIWIFYIYILYSIVFIVDIY